MLSGLQRHVDARHQTELAAPRATAVDDEFGLDVALRGANARHDPALFLDARDLDALEDLRALELRAFGERHGDVDGVHASVARDIKTREEVVDFGERKHLLDLARRDLVHLDAAVSIKRGHTPVLLEAVFVGGDLDKTHIAKTGRLARLFFEAHVEVARVLAKLGARLGERSKAHHEARRVPSRSCGESLLLEENDLAAQVREVVGDRAPDDAAANDDRA